MVVFNLSHNNYQTLLQNLARQLKVKPENNIIIIPKDVGEGIIKVIQLPNGLQSLMIKTHFNKDVLVKSGNTNQGDYVLNFDESEITDEEDKNTTTINSFVRLTSVSFKHWEVVKKNSTVRYVKILFSKEWLSKYIGLREKMSVFEKYIPVKSDEAEKKKLNEEYRRIINELWEINDADPLQNIYYNNRISLLIEQFFTMMHAEMLKPKGKYKMTADDVVKLKKVEAILHSPGKFPPNIEALAKKMQMTKLKLSHAFKQVYGTSVYNYYQNQRMQKAYELLSTGNFSVKVVSEKLGYTNLSNFVLAFTKQFNTSPKSLLE
ncbi:MAG: helix-turn-helix transcriptional regulator [Ginsengibacter sp.]